MWLTLARDGAAGSDDWIEQAYREALKETSEDDQIVARSFLEQYLRSSR